MKKNLFTSTFVVSLMTITSRITGFMRDLVFAHVFGATAGLDAFFIAYRIPNFLRRLFAEGAFSQAFVPVLSEYRQQRTPADIKLFLDRMAGTMSVILFLFTALAVLIAPWLIWIFAPGFSGDASRLELTISMLRITFPYIFFISLTAYVSGILNSYNKFSIPAFTPNLFNLAMIGAAIFLAPHFANPVKALAWGVFLGGLLQLLFQLPYLHKLKLIPTPALVLRDEGVRRVLKLMLPAIFGVSVAQISLFFDTLLASFLPSGSISWLYYSDRLTSFPLGVFGVAIATVVLPHLARNHAAQSHAEFSATIDWALQFVLLVALPSMLAIMLLSGPILATLFKYGKFTNFDVLMAQRSLLAFALGIPAFMLVKVLASAFYSTQNIKTPVKIAIIAMIANIILALILVFPLKHAGLALATSLTSSLNAGLLFWLLRKNDIYKPCSGWPIFLLKSISANLLLVLLLYFGSPSLKVWLNWDGWNKTWHLGVLGVAAIAIYLICMWAMGLLKSLLRSSGGQACH